MNMNAERAVYRLREFRRQGELPKHYQCSYEVLDDNTREVMAVCDLSGKAVFSSLEILDQQQQRWQMRPNRKIMPSRWVVTDPAGVIHTRFDQKILGKLKNPLYRVALSLEDGAGNEIFRLVDPRSNIGDRIFGSGPGEWVLLRGDQPRAKLVRLPRPSEPGQGGKGFWGKLRKFLASSDQGLISVGSRHILPAPVVLGMLLLFNELTDSSAG
ncbi:MAG: hypothetical protein P8X63_01420 [Desulfuromonadaceae bacterium]|jgi:hypothetical protein